MADAGLVYSVTIGTLRNCLCPRQWEAADWGNLGHGRTTILAAELDWHSRRRKVPMHKAPPLHTQAPRKGCYQLEFLPLHCRLAGPSYSYIINPFFSCWLHHDSVSPWPFLHCLILHLRFLPFLQRLSQFKAVSRSVQSPRSLMVPVSPQNRHRKGNSKRSFPCTVPLGMLNTLTCRSSPIRTRGYFIIL